MIPYGRQDIQEEDIARVVEILNSDFLTQGPAVTRFEQAVASFVGAEHAVALNSATSALHLACLALELGVGDSLWTVPTTFVASANCARYCGASVDFVDIDPDTWNISLVALEEKLKVAKQQNQLPKVLVAVHLCGLPTEQERLFKLSQEYGFEIIEDAAHSIGASRAGEKVGSCKWSTITTFSFHPVKLITSGEGGVMVCNRKDLADRVRLLSSHGITKDASQFVGEEKHPWSYEQQMLGFNYRMTDIHAALGESQLGRLTEYVTKRNQLAAYYDECFSKLPVKTQLIPDNSVSAYHLYIVRLVEESHIEQHETIFKKMREAGVGVNVHYIPVHLQPYYQKLGFQAGQFPEAEQYAKSAITLPLYPLLSREQQAKVVSTLQNCLIESCE